MKSVFICLSVLFLGAAAIAAPLDRKDVPEPLRPWIDWVLHGEQEDTCPIIYNNGDQTICAWPSFLTLEVQKTTALFSQKWKVYAEDLWLILPGNKTMWPQEVVVNGSTHPVSDRRGRPAVYIKTPGAYSISGVFSFDRLPEWFRVPEQTGLIKLSINSKTVRFPRLDKEGRLWLRQEGEKETGLESSENRLQVRVHRLIQDDIPLRMVTRLELSVSGKHREVNLGQADTEAFIPMRINSNLPVKIDSDGILRAQVRPGKWTIEIETRHKGMVSELDLNAVGVFNVEEEVWAFDARRHLRQVSIEGPTQIDPLQTTVPDAWRKYPVYLMTAKEKMTFDEKKRGDPHPAPDQLDLERTLWLNFDGKGYSTRDHITGTMTTGWRLEMNPPLELGRVTVNGRQQFITRLKDAEKAGVEMRYGKVNLSAESRIKATGRIPVTGWDRDFQSVKGTLNLPPGWSLFYASGIDNIRQTWFKQWDLMDLFLALFITVVVASFRGWRWGLVALMAVVVLNNEPGAPRWIWLHLLAAIALLRVLPQGKIRYLVDYYRVGMIISLVIISLPFMVSQMKNGIYPQLERPWQVMGADMGAGKAMNGMADEFGSQAMADVAEEAHYEKMSVQAPTRALAGSLQSYRGKSPEPQVSMVDASARIQTGPGIPNWNWRRVTFSWNGPVGKGEQMRFGFISPGANLLLAMIRVVLLAAMIFGLAGVGYVTGRGLDFSKVKPGSAAVLMIMLCCFLFAPAAEAADDFPPESLLKELKIKLTDREAPACLPDCASSPRMKIILDDTSLRIRLEIHALYDNVAVPLPGSDQHWLPETVLVDNRKGVDLYRSPSTGHLWLQVSEGDHQVDLQGRLPQRQMVQLLLPLKPHYVETRVDGWTIDGIHENGVADRQLQFTRIARDVSAASRSAGESFDPVLLPPFLEVNRMLSLGLTWKIETTVRRLTPAGAAVVLDVPLLKGETVTSDIPVENGHVLLSLGPNQQYFTWSSSLEITEQLVLEASDTLDWSEVWQVNIGPVWHAGIEGIPVIHHRDQSGNWLPEWRPWPGETVVFHITRPEGVGGQTHTIENSRMVVKPGRRITHTELSLAVRSSRGSRQNIVLPDKAELQLVEINGKSQAIRQNGRSVTLPLTPGQQNVRLTWKESKKTGWKWKTPRVDLGSPGVDAFITAHIPRNRWVLFCGGPHIGPAVLFWSAVLVVLLMSAGLGRMDLTPLRFRHWLLLGLGLTQASLLIALPVVAWFLMLGYRKKAPERLSGILFNGNQIMLVGMTVAALAALFFGIKQGLLGYPDMQIAGNGSGNYVLNWYQDISGTVLPRAWVFSLPIFIYRLLMLVWALWLAFAILKWLRWAWECFSAGGLWQPVGLRKKFSKKEGPDEAAKEEVDLDLDLPENSIDGIPEI